MTLKRGSFCIDDHIMGIYARVDTAVLSNVRWVISTKCPEVRGQNPAIGSTVSPDRVHSAQQTVPANVGVHRG